MALNPRRDYVSQENCDMSNPEEHFLFGLMQIPVGSMEMMPILESTARTISKHLWDLGYRHHPKLQAKKYQRPVRGQQTHLNGLARWVPMDATDPEPITLPNVAQWTNEEAEWVKAEMKRHGMIHEPQPQLKSIAQVADWETEQTRRVKRATTAEERGIK